MTGAEVLRLRQLLRTQVLTGAVDVGAAVVFLAVLTRCDGDVDWAWQVAYGDDGPHEVDVWRRKDFVAGRHYKHGDELHEVAFADDHWVVRFRPPFLSERAC